MEISTIIIWRRGSAWWRRDDRPRRGDPVYLACGTDRHFGKYRRSRRHERRDFVQGIRHMFGSASLRHATKHYFGSFIDGSLETLCGSADIALAAALVGEPR